MLLLQEDELITYFTNELQSKDKELFIVKKINNQLNNMIVELDEAIDESETKNNKSKSQKQSKKNCL